MHELSLAEEMLTIIQERAAQEACTSVRQINLTLGSLSHVEAEALQFCFDAVVKGTIAEGARLVIERIPAKAHCPACEQTSQPSTLYDACAHCGQFGLAILEGQELRVSSIEVY